MASSDQTAPPPGSPPPDEAAAEAAAKAAKPGIDDSFRQVTAAGKETLGGARDSARALRKLLFADIALARAALGRALIWTCVAIVFGASGWLLSAAAAIALLRSSGLSWTQAMTAAAVFSLLVTCFGAWRVKHYFDHAGLQATRRQLVRMGLMDEDDDDDATAPPPAPSSTRQEGR
ncbi:hypothetical protein [Pseudoxanthomonas dokdonensis]|uniref:Membrane protein n=1 Tax=Pseudoxanthomonas dokdonensis TaxID=344882 RepID=A0A0R0D2W9_9GAMM|nr:hypothetical protein [Pseudoxanthomonas dokdonensis]KRG71720.1 membrane protein [Pseudoxanthomonas dokdonensis]